MEVKESVIIYLLGHFKKMSGMYLDRNHISLLSTFLSGYEISLITNGFDITTDPFFGKEDEGFFNWYSKKYRITTTSSWYATMLEQCNNSEED